jgi:hypothetical protein
MTECEIAADGLALAAIVANQLPATRSSEARIGSATLFAVGTNGGQRLPPP